MMAEKTTISERELQEGGKLFEMFWLRPNKYAEKKVPLRIRINKKWGGWKIKDELISSIGLEVGDTISTEVTPYFMSGIIDDADDTDLFASASAADWLLENQVGVGAIIDVIVRFCYSKAPVGMNGKMVNKISLVMEDGIRVVGTDPKYSAEEKGNSSNDMDNLFRALLEE
jgi:hypothetical protein